MDIVRFKGGLGNQMFQYAFLKSLESRNREVGASLGFYDDFPNTRRYVLDKVFPKISMKTGYDDVFVEKFNKWRSIRESEEKHAQLEENACDRFFWNELDIENGYYREDVYNTKACVFVGYWQSYKYFEDIRDLLISDFSFVEGDEHYTELKNKLHDGDNWISVHIRRGDYLDHSEIYGGICTENYYRNAIKIMKEHVKNPYFIFSSDDIDWVEQHFEEKDAIYIKADMFETYNDWYDMSLMSVCRGNIIANSSFSWWGAWLNNREDQIVIAPSKWNNIGEFNDICPKEWIRI